MNRPWGSEIESLRNLSLMQETGGQRGKQDRTVRMTPTPSTVQRERLGCPGRCGEESQPLWAEVEEGRVKAAATPRDVAVQR